MSDSLALTTVAYALGLGCWTTLRALRGQARAAAQGGAVAVLEGALALQALVVAGAWARGTRAAEPATFAGYLAASLLVLPAAWLLVRDDDGPWSTSRLAVAAWAVAAVVLRMGATWGHGG